MAINKGYTIFRQLVSTNFIPSTYHTSQKLQQYAIRNDFLLKYGVLQEYITKVEQSMNTFKDYFFSSSLSETVNTTQFKDGGYITSESNYVFCQDYFYAGISQSS